MATLGRRRSRNKQLFVAIALLLILTAIGDYLMAGALRQTAGSVAAPLLTVGHNIHRTGETFWAGYFAAERQDEQIAELQRQIAELKLQSAGQIASVARENLARDISTTLPEAGYDLVLAPVLAQPSPGGRQRLWIQGGRDREFREGMVALGPGGIAGVIEDVYASQSSVLLITDQDSLWGAEIEGRSEEFGTLRATSDHGAALYFNRTATKAQAGDWVISTGMSGSMAPAGVPFGRVAEITHNKKGEPVARLELPDDPSQLRTVFIMPEVRLPKVLAGL